MIPVFDAIHGFFMVVPSHRTPSHRTPRHWTAFKRSLLLIAILFILMGFDVIRHYGQAAA